MYVELSKFSVALFLIGAVAQGADEPGRWKRQTSPLCDPTERFRQPDSFCNNLIKPEQGAAFDILSRSRAPAYEDGKGYPRQTGVGGKPLPDPRIISTTVHRERKVVDGRHSTMLMQWGQFINHDMVATPNTTDSEGDITDCCKTNIDVTNNPFSDCFPIHVRADPYFNTGRCINFVRSIKAPGTGQSINKPRETFNSASAFIDGSHIYGSFKELEEILRSKKGGELRVKLVSGAAFPPQDKPEKCFQGNNPESFCFLTGDIRANVFAGLSALHVIFLREHNRVASSLSTIHPGWGDEKLFQEAKRIVIAELQIITYRDWLPLVLGPDYTSLYSINDNYVYDSTMSARISNVFSTSAMRFGHSMIPEKLNIGGRDVFVANLISTTREVIRSVENVLKALLAGDNHKADAWFVNDMTRHMFQTKPTVKDGYDIVSLNIQRGRDHGIADYNKWRQHCQLGRADDFTEDVFDWRNVQAMKNVYNNIIDDLDLFTGSMSEWPVPGGVVGDTNACLIAEQFMKVRFGDRFFWETDNPAISFTPQQKTELRKTSLARILCDNSKVDSLQSDVFLKLSDSNPGVSCGSLPAIDLTKW